MNTAFTLRKYDKVKDYPALMKLIKAEGEEWTDYLKPGYKTALENSISFVALAGNRIVGYSRSINDSGQFIWLIDLLVDPAYRGKALGRHLMECAAGAFPHLDVFVMSDVDPYYEKLGYSKEGSIFKALPPPF